MFKVEQTTKEIHLSLMAGCYVICKKKKAQISPVHQLWTIRLFNGSFDLFHIQQMSETRTNCSSCSYWLLHQSQCLNTHEYKCQSANQVCLFFVCLLY